MHQACQSCKKQPATVHLTDILPGGEKRERHLCEQCAEQEQVMPKASQVQVSLSELLGGLVSGGGKAAIQQLIELRCPHCELSFIEFRQNGLLGCPRDYDPFEKALVPLIERAHEGSSHHIGKVPRRLGTPRPTENDLIRLKRRLAKAVEDEQYEEAARLRDEIKLWETQ
jgi:protein arginine kinase activator